MNYIKSFNIDFLKISGFENWNSITKYITQENSLLFK